MSSIDDLSRMPNAAAFLQKIEEQAAQQQRQAEAARQRQISENRQEAQAADFQRLREALAGAAADYDQREKLVLELMPMLTRLLAIQHAINEREAAARQIAFVRRVPELEFEQQFRRNLPPWRRPGFQPVNQVEAHALQALAVLLSGDPLAGGG
jgi:hypothetical protein